MRKLICLAPLLLSGCANFVFDPVEFNNMVTVKELTTTAYNQCGTPEAAKPIDQIQRLIDHQLLYSSYREARSVEFNIAIINLKEIADGLSSRYKTEVPSKVYCQEKLKLIASGSSTIARILGRL
jgi:hypothetical protein